MMWLTRLRRDGRGATLVETAIVLPLVLLLIFGIIDGARFIAAKNTVHTASHEAARYGSSVGDNGSGTKRYLDCDGIINAGIELSGGALEVANFKVFYDTGPGTTQDWKCEAGKSAEKNVVEGDRVVVEVTDGWQAVTPIVGRVFGPFTVSSVAHRTINSPG